MKVNNHLPVKGYLNQKCLWLGLLTNAMIKKKPKQSKGEEEEGAQGSRQRLPETPILPLFITLKNTRGHFLFNLRSA